MYSIGIDLGGTNIAAGLVDDNFTILATANRKTQLPRPSAEIVADMAAVAREAATNAGVSFDKIASVGVGCPGTCNGDTGIVEYSNNLRFEQVSLRDDLAALLGCSVYVENDANAAALGEAMAGAARGTRSSVCITLGTGVGGGTIVDGKIISGANFAGGELGHTVIVVDGDVCTCGRRGCWEAYASATGLINMTKRAMAEYPESLMHKLAQEMGHVSGRTAFDAMRAGDPAGERVVQRYIRYTAAGLINVVNIFQPEVLSIGGGICNEGETLLAPLRAYLEEERYSKHSVIQTRLVRAELGNQAGIIGAAALGR